MVAIAGLIVVGCVGLWYIAQVNPSGDPGPVEVFKVLPTDTRRHDRRALAGRGLIARRRVFRYYVDHNGGLELTPGDYELRPLDHVGNIMRVLRTPPSLTYTKVTFPEGLHLREDEQRVWQRSCRGSTPTAFRMRGHRRHDPVAAAAAGGSTRWRACCSPTRTRSPVTRLRAHMAQRMVDLMDLVVRQEDVVAKADAQGLTPTRC